MKVLGSTRCTLPFYNKDVTVCLWEKGDPYPTLGKSVGIDTETELITAEVQDPPMVVYGLFDPDSATCWISYWDQFMDLNRYVNRSETQQRYFNLGFDEIEIDNEDDEGTLKDAIEARRVRDMQIRYHLWLLATWGDIPEKGFKSLEDVTRRKLKIDLDKGKADDPDSHRLTFRRYNPDGSKYVITDKQAVYLAWDCMATWALGEVIPEQPTEVQHTKGMCVLAHIRRNGIKVDPFVWDAMEKQTIQEKEEARLRLMAFGYPDPDKRNDDVTPQKELFYDSLRKFCEVTGQPDISENATVSKDRMRFLFSYAQDFSGTADMEAIDRLAQIIVFALDGKTTDKQIKPNKSILQVYNSEVLEPYDLYAFDSNKNKITPMAMVGAFLEDAVRQYSDKNTLYRAGFFFKDAIEHTTEYMDDHPWLIESKKGRMGPKKFFQNHVQGIIQKYPKLELDKTKKGQLKLAKDDMWKLEDLGIKDDFLTAYTEYYHLRKLLSTYLNRSFIGSDGRIRAHFQNLVRTSRTSCRAPNMQNLPSREKHLPLKNVFVPYDGMVMCATDFSFIELVSFAQTCYSRFGFSTMRDLINAGIDPHRWFAGIMKGIIKADLKGKDDPQWVADLMKYLEANVTDDERQLSKCANFGLPGRMGAARFYKHLRTNGFKVTVEQAADMCNAWTNAFPEMKYHKNPERADSIGRLQYEMFGKKPAYREDDEDEEDEEDLWDDEATGKDDSFDFKAVLPCGQIRNRCSICAACNAQFQGTTSVGGKVAGWNLVLYGYGERLVNYIHDEYLYCLYPEEIQVHVPIIERLMIAGMKTVTPDVKVSVETTCMRHWDKKAAKFEKLKWNDDGTPILEEPPYIQNLLLQKE